MIVPVCNEILGPSGECDIVPICRKIYADVVTPITLLRHITERSNCFYLLEGIEGSEKWERYSFLGYNPVVRVTRHYGEVKAESHVSRFPSGKIQTTRPMDMLREILTQYKTPRLKGWPPFTGGFVGCFAYTMIEYAEPTLHISRGRTNGFDLMLFDKVIVYDHLKQKIQIVVNMKTGRTEGVGRAERGDREEQEHCESRKGGEDRENRNTHSGLEYLMKEYGRACEEIQEMASLISDTAPLRRLSSSEKPSFVCSVSKEEFYDTVEKTEGYILDGDIFQAVISRQFASSYEGNLLDTYRVLRTTNPFPYMVYMNTGQDETINASSETLVRLKNRRLTTFPIAGPQPGGNEGKEGRKLEGELLADEKELSEYSMLVNLRRNDIGRIAGFGSVEVTKYKMIHKYSKIMHICSQVGGNIKSSPDDCSTVESLLPAGALSGAPKIRACGVIEKLESTPRRIYGGALGYLDFTENLDTCIAIRVAVKQAGKATAQAGGGIVAGSISGLRYKESTNRARAVVRAALQAGKVDDR